MADAVTTDAATGADYDPATYDPLSPEVKQQAEKHFEALRRHCPVHRHRFTPADLAKQSANPFVAHQVTEMYSFLRHADVEEILQSPDRFLSIEGAGPERMAPVDGTGMLAWADGATHRRQRKICLPAFAPKNIAPLSPLLQVLIDDLLDDVADHGAIEVMTEFAQPVTSGMLTYLLGLPIERRADVLDWGLTLLASFGGDEAAYERGAVVLGALAEFLAEVGPERAARTAAGEDLHDAVSHVLTSVDDDGSRFSEGEALFALAQFVGAGMESSATAIVNGVYLLCTNPGERRKLAQDPELINTAVEEIVRYMSPVEGTCRTAATELRFRGHDFSAGTKIRPVYSSANRDEDAFTDADVFRVDRDRAELRRHVAFGAGVHSCIGAALARQELKQAVSTLFRRIPSLRLDPAGTPHRNTAFIVHGFDELHLQWDPDTVLPRSDGREHP